MNWMMSFLVALITGIVGLIGAGFAAGAYASWYHMTTREGAAGFFVLGMGLLGGMASFVIGLLVARIGASGAPPSFVKAIAASNGIILAICGLVVLVCYLLADFPPTIDGEELRLEVEIRLPAGHAKPVSDEKSTAEFTLGSVVNHTRRASQPGTLKVADAREENGRWIIPAEVFVFTTRGDRSIDARLGGESIAGFVIPLPARPGKEHEQWSKWMPQPPAGSSPWPDTKSSFRFRVQRIPPPPPPPTQEEMEKQEEAQKQAEFDALPSNSPLTAWLPYTQYGGSETRRDMAIQRMMAQPNFIKELGGLMLDADPRRAESAMRLIPQLPNPTADHITSVTAAGRDIIQRLKRANATTEEQDPHYEAVSDVSIRFSAWMSAVRTLREKVKGDFTPELREILDLSRIRTDSYVMQQDIRRVSSFYLKEWAGVEPLPGDPPPK